MPRPNALARLNEPSSEGFLSLSVRLRQQAKEHLDALATRLGGSDFEERMAQIAARLPAGGVDPFGFDLEWGRYSAAALAVLYRRYFRVEAYGIDNIPQGRVLLIANHSGQLPIDAALIASAVFLDGSPARVVRSMVEKWTQTLPVISKLFARCGQVLGVPENAERLLSSEEALLVFPEGVRGINKPFIERYKLRDFGLGFMRLALQTSSPIVPVAVIGAEEQYINVGNLSSVARTLGMPEFPLIPQWLVPGGLLPLPTKYRIYFGTPMIMRGDPDDEDAVIQEKVDVVRRTIQGMVNRGLKERRHVFW